MRIKTENEFIAEYGETWGNSLVFGWDESMNLHLGTPVTDDELHQLNKFGEFSRSIFYRNPANGSWQALFSNDTLTDKPLVFPIGAICRVVGGTNMHRFELGTIVRIDKHYINKSGVIEYTCADVNDPTSWQRLIQQELEEINN